jgi:hypothetical protein
MPYPQRHACVQPGIHVKFHFTKRELTLTESVSPYTD